jgi:hypothetical protein
MPNPRIRARVAAGHGDLLRHRTRTPLWMKDQLSSVTNPLESCKETLVLSYRFALFNIPVQESPVLQGDWSSLCLQSKGHEGLMRLFEYFIRLQKLLDVKTLAGKGFRGHSWRVHYRRKRHLPVQEADMVSRAPCFIFTLEISKSHT